MNEIASTMAIEHEHRHEQHPRDEADERRPHRFVRDALRRPFHGAPRDDEREARDEREQHETEGRADEARHRPEAAEVEGPPSVASTA